MTTPEQLKIATLFAVSTSLALSGAIVATSAFATLPLKNNPSYLSLRELRDVFSRGSHTIPPLATFATALYALLAYNAAHVQQRNGWIAAGVGTISIAPFTMWVMVPACNGKLIQADEEGERGLEKIGGKQGLKTLLEKFDRLNYVRAALMGFGGLMGLWTAMA